MEQNTNCCLCPRNCNADRRKTSGFCGADESPRIAKAMLHLWEEPCICTQNGSGAVFFSGCQLKCVFCQNHMISQNKCGDEYTPDQLADLFLSLEEKGACNINLVSATPFIPSVVSALEKAKSKGLTLPTVLNSGGYEKISTLKMLDGLIDIYLPDFKFFDPRLSFRFTGAKDYSEICRGAIREMHRQAGNPTWNGKHLKNGVIVRHLVLPGATIDSEKILDILYEDYHEDGIILSLMRQYTPVHRAKEFPPLNRKLTTLEYTRVENHAKKLNFSYLYTQRKESASENYIPDFSAKID